MNFLRNLFSQPKGDAFPDKPIIVSGENGNLSQQETVLSESIVLLSHLLPGIHVGKSSDLGRQRKQNEDSLYIMQASLGHENELADFGLFIVADGMGGHQNGEVASALATQTGISTILKEIYLPDLTGEDNPDGRPLNEVLISAVTKANEVVHNEVPNGGTTLTMALVMGNTAYIAHVGDTRVYFFKERELKQITTDHSLASRLEEIGQSTVEEIEQAQNVLYKAIGQSDLVAADVDTYVQHLPPGSSLLMCTDGLWGLVNDDDITNVLLHADTPQLACEQLVKKANECGGRDNITVIIISMGIEKQEVS